MSDHSKHNAEKRTPPDDIELRVNPRPVRRINRKVLMGGTALLSLVLFGAVMVALDPPDFQGGQQVQELYNTDRKPVADGLAGLPSTYDAIPKLGPPLPGDIGDALHKVDTNAQPELPIGDKPFQPDPEADIARADRIRLARLAQQGRESKLFYSVAAERKVGNINKEEGTAKQAQPSPFAALGQLDALQGQVQPTLQTAQDKKLAFLNAKPDRFTTNTACRSPYRHTR
jgi:type IV secretion system protein TrbI